MGSVPTEEPHLGRVVEPLRPPEALLVLLVEQQGRCAVCAGELVVPPNAADDLTGVVDRDARSQAVRGLLCHRCHEGLTLFGADAVRLQRAAAYLDAAPRSDRVFATAASGGVSE